MYFICLSEEEIYASRSVVIVRANLDLAYMANNIHSLDYFSFLRTFDTILVPTDFGY